MMHANTEYIQEIARILINIDRQVTNKYWQTSADRHKCETRRNNGNVKFSWRDCTPKKRELEEKRSDAPTGSKARMPDINRDIMGVMYQVPEKSYWCSQGKTLKSLCSAVDSRKTFHDQCKLKHPKHRARWFFQIRCHGLHLLWSVFRIKQKSTVS